jgi:hypothetical protein
MKITSRLVLSMMPLVVAACASSSPTPPRAAAPAAPAPTADPSTPPPSLASELAAKNRRDSEKASLKVGVKVEEQTKATAPSWFAPAVMTQGRGGGSALAPKLNEAVDAAVSKAGAQVEARGGNPRSLKVERVAYARLSTGEYVAWAAIGDGSNMGEVATAPVVEPSTPAVAKPTEPPMPSLNNPKAAIATGVKTDEGVKQVEQVKPVATAAKPATEAPKAAEQTKPVAATKPADAKAAEMKPVAAKPADVKMVEIKPAEAAKPSEVKKPAEATKPAEAKKSEATVKEASLPSLANPRAAVTSATPTIQAIPAPQTPPAKQATPVIDDGSIPGWWDPAPTQRGKRVALSVRVDGATPRDCARATLMKGREALEAAVGEAPRELLTDRTWLVSLPDGTHRMFSIVSCTGTLKTKDSTKP